jgi:hypothetical protein
MVIRSNPPGAAVYVDGNPNPIGTTPVARNYTYYGVREFRLVKDGYETKVVKQPISPPWYEWIGMDFISENLVPGEIRDYRTFDYPLEPQKVTPSDQLVRQGEALRQQTRAAVAPQGAAPPGPAFPGAAVPAPTGPVAPAAGAVSPFAPSPGAPSFPSPPSGGYATPPSWTAPSTSPGVPPALSPDRILPEQSSSGSSLPIEPPGGWQPRD